QWAEEPSDPQVYARRIVREPAPGEAPRPVLLEQGLVDHYILPSIANSLSLSQPTLASRLPLVGRGVIALPAAHAGVVVQHPGDAIEDGHEVVFQTEAPQHQYRCFLSSFAAGAPMVPADAAADAPCP
ncbi:MAG: hypothetical protein ACXVDD_02845, partial [Polyangia bacterium]